MTIKDPNNPNPPCIQCAATGVIDNDPCTYCDGVGHEKPLTAKEKLEQERLYQEYLNSQ